MFYYAFINESNVVTGVYALPSAITMSGYVEITKQQYDNSQAQNENSIIGKVYNAETNTFEDPFIWSCSTSDIEYKDTETSLETKLDTMDAIIEGKANSTDLHTHSNKDVLDSITADKVTAWDSSASGSGTPGSDGEDGATFTPSVSADGVLSWTNDKGLANPDPVNIKGADGTNGTNGVDGVNGTDGIDGTTVIVGTTTTGEAGTSACVTGTLNAETNTLTLNFTVPKGEKGDAGESGISASITADEVLTKIKTVDGENSGLDADTLDGIHANGFAAVNHTHSNYATVSALDNLSEAVDGKANVNHVHSGYASINDVTTLETAVNGKADTAHTHGVATTSANGFLSSSDKSKLDGIATGANKTTVDSALSSTSTNPVQNKVINTALTGKANTSHTHTLDDVSETTSKKIMTATERTKLNGIETGANKYTHPSTHAATMITGLSTVATSGKYSDLTGVPSSFAPSTHTHAQSDITGLTTALDSKANANHTHDYCTLSQVYPVGSIYLSVNNTNPRTLFGGTWVAFGTGKVLMGVKSGGSAEATGGSETATIAAHEHTTAAHKLTLNEIPSHNHALLNYNADGNTTYTFTKNSVTSNVKKGYDGNVMTTYKGGDQAHSHGNTGSAGAATINVVQPYITCYMWKRTN